MYNIPIEDRSTLLSTHPACLTRYRPSEIIGFYKNRESPFGIEEEVAYAVLSNMYPTPIEIAGNTYKTTELVYHMLRFPHMPRFQAELANKPSPLVVKWAVGGKKKTHTHDAFLLSQVQIMDWLVRLKWYQHPELFQNLFYLSMRKPFCEVTPRDRIWGVVRDPNAVPTNAPGPYYTGLNLLGKIWTQIRDEFIQKPNKKLQEPVPQFDTSVLLLEGNKLV